MACFLNEPVLRALFTKFHESICNVMIHQPDCSFSGVKPSIHFAKQNIDAVFFGKMISTVHFDFSQEFPGFIAVDEQFLFTLSRFFSPEFSINKLLEGGDNIQHLKHYIYDEESGRITHISFAYFREILLFLANYFNKPQLPVHKVCTEKYPWLLNQLSGKLEATFVPKSITCSLQHTMAQRFKEMAEAVKIDVDVYFASPYNFRRLHQFTLCFDLVRTQSNLTHASLEFILSDIAANMPLIQRYLQIFEGPLKPFVQVFIPFIPKTRVPNFIYYRCDYDNKFCADPRDCVVSLFVVFLKRLTITSYEIFQSESLFSLRCNACTPISSLKEFVDDRIERGNEIFRMEEYRRGYGGDKHINSFHRRPTDNLLSSSRPLHLYDITFDDEIERELVCYAIKK